MNGAATMPGMQWTRMSCLMGALLAAWAPAQEESPPIGATLPDLAFTDIRFLPRRLSELKSRRGTVIFIAGTACPIVRRYYPRMVKLQRRFAPKGIRFLALYPVPGESVLDAAAHALEHGVPFPVGKDFEGRTTRALGATRLGQVLVLDARRRLVYRGRIDSQYRLGGARPDPGRGDLREALRDLLADRPVRVSATPVDGCLLAFPAAPPAAQKVTYHEQVAPIIGKHCTRCHRAGGEAPFVLTSYSAARGSGGMLAEVVRQRRMPPWYAAPSTSVFKGAPAITEEERRVLVDWVRGGMAPGKAPATRPSPPAASTWAIGTPDLVLEAPRTIEVPKEGWFPYQYLVFAHAFERDTWVQAIEVRPSNGRVMHHCNVFWNRKGQPFNTDGYLTGKVPGGHPLDLPAGTAVLIPKDSFLFLAVHYVTTGKPERDRPSVGLVFPKVPVRHRLRHVLAGQTSFEIPAGAQHHELVAETRLPTRAVGYALYPHMHLRGKDMTMIARAPDGTQETLLQVPSYSFDWQASYYWPPGRKVFAKGTVLRCIAHYDNSSFNPFNPDATSAARFGYQAFHEMFYGFLFYVDPDEKLDLVVDPKTGSVR